MLGCGEPLVDKHGTDSMKLYSVVYGGCVAMVIPNKNMVQNVDINVWHVVVFFGVHANSLAGSR